MSEEIKDKETLDEPSQETESAPQVEGEKEENNELNELKIKYDELYDKHLRVLAEYDNFKKRTQKEKDELYKVAVCDTIEKILPVVDNLERAVETQTEKTPFYEGVCLVEKQLFEILEKMGVKQIEAVGKTFDPNVHNAVMHTDDDEKGEAEIVEEFAKGYCLGDKVIRYSMVKVAN
ncbi:MAG: nucleotide exchange factor GrpE [Ruminococcaceae bacterium]|nr:nucleotide exchange factor GrpE [Oscillospiraceae bacterium]